MTEQEKQLVKELVRHHSYLKNKRLDNDTKWAVLNGVFRPEMAQIERSGQNAGRFNENLYDSFGAQSLHIWSRGIIGNMIYPKPQWLRVSMAERFLMENDQVIDYLQEWSEQLFHGFNRTNFYGVMPEMALDAGTTVGHLFPMIDTKRQKLHFQHEHPGDIWYALDAFGNIERVHRECSLTITAASERFGTLPPALRNLENPFKEIEFVHCVFPNPLYDPSRPIPYSAAYLPWASVYYEKTTQFLIENSGLPWIPLSWRVHKHPRLWYPYSPAECALTDALMNNNMSEDLVKLGHLSAQPPLWAPQELKVVRTPNGVTKYRDPNQVVRKLYDRLDWNIPNEERERLHNQIEKWMSIPFFALLTKLAENAQPPTAYQIAQSQAEKATLLGPQVSSLQSDILDPVIDIVWQWEEATSTVPEMPQILVDYLMERQQTTGLAQVETVNEYTGILSQIQASAIKTRALTESIGMAQALVNLFPEAKYVLKEYNLMKDILQSGNMDQDNIRSKEEYEEIIRGLMESQALQEQAERQRDIATAYEKVAKGKKEIAA